MRLLQLGFHYGQLLQGLLHAGRALGGRAGARGGLAVRRGGRIVVQFIAQRLDLGRRFVETLLQALAPPKGGAPRAGADPHAILGDPRERHQTLAQKRGDTARQQRIHGVPMGHAKIRQGVVVHRDAPGDPAVGIVLITEAKIGRASCRERVYVLV